MNIRANREKMESTNIIQVNTKADLIFTYEGEGYNIMCEIKGFTADSVMLFCPPNFRQLATRLKPGLKVELHVYTQTGVVVMGATTKERVLGEIILITFPVEKKRIQRREYFRVGVQRKVEILYNDGYKDKHFKGKSIDISGGGIRFWTLEPVQVGFMADIIMHIGDLCDTNETVPGRGRILYTKAHDSRFTSKTGYISVIKFSDITANARKLIMKTCFRVQIDMKKKGII
jgi:c-di-GMP-binding flagellar brake protein YcgR